MSNRGFVANDELNAALRSVLTSPIRQRIDSKVVDTSTSGNDRNVNAASEKVTLVEMSLARQRSADI